MQNIKFTVICDVKNKLCGLKGAVFTYGKQKGAQDDDLKVLESGLINLIKKTKGGTFSQYRWCWGSWRIRIWYDGIPSCFYISWN